MGSIPFHGQGHFRIVLNTHTPLASLGSQGAMKKKNSTTLVVHEMEIFLLSWRKICRMKYQVVRLLYPIFFLESCMTPLFTQKNYCNSITKGALDKIQANFKQYAQLLLS